jgi:ABC-type cobalamin/Fe3+-siderophores transport system ATPase subunit
MEANVAFNLSIPKSTGGSLDLTVEPGQTIFVLGANGSGKSALMQKLYAPLRMQARRITAHRQTWFASNAVSLSAQDKRTHETNMVNYDFQDLARWKDEWSTQRTGMTIYDLIDAENVAARDIAEAVRRGDLPAASKLALRQAPVAAINDLLRLSNIPVVISVKEGDQVVASKSGGANYSAAELSDGERNALLLGVSVLTAKQGTLILIDEPERHLHRSIISPLLKHLFEQRTDCAFVISTHDVELSLDHAARTLLVRGCTVFGSTFQTWDIDLVEAGAEVDERLKRDIFGARRKVLFVEGGGTSLDAPLYGVIVPEASVVPKGNSREVEQAVSGIRGAAAFHWVRAFGIIDGDGRSPVEIETLKARGVYALPVFSVESIYYEPGVQRAVAERHAAVTGANLDKLVANAKAAALTAVEPHVPRLSARVVEKHLRERVLGELPGWEEIAGGKGIAISFDLPAALTSEKEQIQALIHAGDLARIIARYPVRETPALARIAVELGFQDTGQYESAVRTLLAGDDEARAKVKALFGTLDRDIAGS